MDLLETFIPPDRRRALASGESLPDRADGAVLFADISGFTPLTEAMTRSLGARRGAEELTKQLNRVYDALIAVVEEYGGSVITFSGDAITCWFPASGPAVACACALQEAMQPFNGVPLPDGITTALGIKVTVAMGMVRRWIVGDPQLRRIDMIAGRTVARTAAAELLAQRGEILLDEPTVAQLDLAEHVTEWREDPESGDRFGVLGTPYLYSPPPQPPTPALEQSVLQEWLDPAVFTRICVEGEVLLTELRPVVALFARFHGIEFDADEHAGSKLDQFVRRVQQVLARYDGSLLELTIGDKGSYFYATFGAPHTHEDDARRAVLAARELFPLCRELTFIEPLQIGISQGVMRVGSYGGLTRRTYGAQGDEVNLAARLMTRADPGAVLVSGRIQKAIANEFDLEPLAPIHLKGKAEPLLPFAVQGVRQTRVQQIQEAYYSLPMIGRERELARVHEKLALARQGKGQIIAITAPAGLGKSRLTAEVIRSVRRLGEASYGGECQSFGTNTSYLVWAPIWRAFFGIDNNLALRRQLRALESEIQELVPERANAMPLLGALLHLAIPDNDFTRELEPSLRKSALYALLRDALVSAAEQARLDGQLLLFVIEDAHWIDPASRELLSELALQAEALPVVFLLNYRPPEAAGERFELLEGLNNFTVIELGELTSAQGEGLIRAKLAQHAPESTETIPDELITRINAQAQGNPFYIEQLLDYMHDRGVNLRDPGALTQLDVPNTLHRLVLSRLDQLSEQQQMLLKAASVIGRWFSLAHLCGYFPRVGAPEQVEVELARLQQYNFTTLEHPEPELAYLFKHIVTQQVAYESLSFATRATLHEAYARYLESHEETDRVLDLLAYHYDHSENLPKRRDYLQRAGEAAAARFSNVEAVDYITRALALAPESDFAARYDLLSTREQVFNVMGSREQQRADLSSLEDAARALGDEDKELRVLLKRGWHAERLTDHAEATTILNEIQAALGVPPAQGRRTDIQTEAELLQGVILWQQGMPALAKPHFETALEMARASDMRAEQMNALNMLGLVYLDLGDYGTSQTCHLQRRELARAAGDRRNEFSALNNLALVARARGNLDETMADLTEAMRILGEVGDRVGEALVLSNLALTAMEQGDFDRAQAFEKQSLGIATAVRDRRSIARIILNMGETKRQLGDYEAAQRDLERALALTRELHDQLNENIALMNLAALALNRGEAARAREWISQGLPLARAVGHREGEGFLLNTLAQVQLEQGEADAARETFEQALSIWQALEPSIYALDTYAGLAELALQRGEREEARSCVESILAYLESHAAQRGTPSALNGSLAAYHVLVRLGDPRAASVLEAAQRALLERAEKISDETRRRTFLDKVRINLQVLETAPMHA